MFLIFNCIAWILSCVKKKSGVSLKLKKTRGF